MRLTILLYDKEQNRGGKDMQHLCFLEIRMAEGRLTVIAPAMCVIAGLETSSASTHGQHSKVSGWPSQAFRMVTS